MTDSARPRTFDGPGFVVPRPQRVPAARRHSEAARAHARARARARVPARPQFHIKWTLVLAWRIRRAQRRYHDYAFETFLRLYLEL